MDVLKNNCWRVKKCLLWLFLVAVGGCLLAGCNPSQPDQTQSDTENTGQRVLQNDYAEPGLHFLVAKEAELKEDGQIQVKEAEELVSKHIAPESQKDLGKESWFYRYEGIINIEESKCYQISFGKGPMSKMQIEKMYAVDIFGKNIYTWTGDEWDTVYPEKKSE